MEAEFAYLTSDAGFTVAAVVLDLGGGQTRLTGKVRVTSAKGNAFILEPVQYPDGHTGYAVNFDHPYKVTKRGRRKYLRPDVKKMAGLATLVNSCEAAVEWAKKTLRDYEGAGLL